MRISKTLTMYAKLPSYKSMFEREGVSEPGDLALVGSAAEVQDAIGNLKSAGVSDYAATIFALSKDDHIATRELLCGSVSEFK